MKLLTEKKLNDLFVVVFAFAIVIISLIVDKNNLPLGWEIPKVEFWQLFSLMVISVYLVKYIFLLIKKKIKFSLPNKYLLLLYLVIFLSIAFADKNYLVIDTANTTLIYHWLISLISDESIYSGKVALWGNQFRYFGGITVYLILTTSLILKNALDNKNWKYLLYAFLTSAVLQSLWGLSQFISLLGEKDVLREAKWVFGGYGQPNFLIGHLLVGIVFVYYLLSQSNRAARTIGYTCIALFNLVAVLTISYWGILIVLLVNLVLLLDLFRKHKFIRKKLHYIFVAAILLMVPGINLLGLVDSDFLFRAYIWADIYDFYLKRSFIDFSLTGLRQTLFGDGFDSLLILMSRSQRIINPYIDRAHNLVFDLLASIGVIGTSIIMFLSLKGLAIKNNIKKVPDEIFYPAFAFLALFVRSLIHTNSINNIMHLLVLLMMVYALKTTVKDHRNDNG